MGCELILCVTFSNWILCFSDDFICLCVDDKRRKSQVETSLYQIMVEGFSYEGSKLINFKRKRFNWIFLLGGQ